MRGGYLVALEAVNCANCGASDVQEVKPGTFFCNHCESVFKHVDPATVTVGPAFCEHGNVVRVQCQVCRAGMCAEQCDVVPAWGGGFWGIVRTQGFGYLEYRQGYFDVDVDGPFLSVGKLLMSLARARNLALPSRWQRESALSHVCCGCVTQAVPVAADYISTGVICESVRCWETPSGKCPCCQGSFCRECSMPQVAAGHPASDLRGPDFDRSWQPAGICALDPEYAGKRNCFPVVMSAPDGMCHPCAMEHDDKVASVAARICREQYAGKLVPDGGYVFRVPAVPVRRRKHDEERARAGGLARRYVKEIRAQLSGLVACDGNCHREQVHVREGKGLPYAEYVIADDRDRVSPAAVSNVIWAHPEMPYRRRRRPGT